MSDGVEQGEGRGSSVRGPRAGSSRWVHAAACVAALFGCSGGDAPVFRPVNAAPAPPPVRALPGGAVSADLSFDERVAAIANALTQAGAQVEPPRERRFEADTAFLTERLERAPDARVGVVVVGDDVPDLRLRVSAIDRPEVFERDAAPGPDAWVELRPGAPERVRLQVLAPGGPGRLALIVYRAGRPVNPTRALRRTPPAEPLAAEREVELRSLGFVPIGRLQGRSGQRKPLPTPLLAGRCYALSAIGRHDAPGTLRLFRRGDDRDGLYPARQRERSFGLAERGRIFWYAFCVESSGEYEADLGRVRVPHGGQMQLGLWERRWTAAPPCAGAACEQMDLRLTEMAMEGLALVDVLEPHEGVSEVTPRAGCVHLMGSGVVVEVEDGARLPLRDANRAHAFCQAAPLRLSRDASQPRATPVLVFEPHGAPPALARYGADGLSGGQLGGPGTVDGAPPAGRAPSAQASSAQATSAEATSAEAAVTLAAALGLNELEGFASLPVEVQGEGGSRRLELRAEAGACFAVRARAQGRIEGTVRGRRLSIDAATNGDWHLRFCTPRGGRVRVDLDLAGAAAPEISVAQRSAAPQCDLEWAGRPADVPSWAATDRRVWRQVEHAHLISECLYAGNALWQLRRWADHPSYWRDFSMPALERALQRCGRVDPAPLRRLGLDALAREARHVALAAREVLPLVHELRTYYAGGAHFTDSGARGQELRPLLDGLLDAARCGYSALLRDTRGLLLAAERRLVDDLAAQPEVHRQAFATETRDLRARELRDAAYAALRPETRDLAALRGRVEALAAADQTVRAMGLDCDDRLLAGARAYLAGLQRGARGEDLRELYRVLDAPPTFSSGRLDNSFSCGPLYVASCRRGGGGPVNVDFCRLR